MRGVFSGRGLIREVKPSVRGVLLERWPLVRGAL